MQEKVKQSIQYLQDFCSDTYTILNSGGKDSAVLKELCLMAEVPFKQVHSLTTVDAPETVYYIREQQDIEIIRPKKSMWQLIVDKMIPPTRLMRYCCAELKETYGEGELLITGVRKAESNSRKRNNGIATIPDKRKKAYKAFKEINDDFDRIFTHTEKGGWILNNDNEAGRDIVEHCYRQYKVLINPIVDWEDADVWNFIQARKIKINPLYGRGFCRVGCIGCPMADKKRYSEFNMYPKYKQLYIHAFDRMIQNRLEHGKQPIWRNGEDCFRWWMGENPNQLRFEDVMQIKSDMVDIHYQYDPV